MPQGQPPAPRDPRPPAIFTIHIGSKTLWAMLAALAILAALITLDVADRLSGSQMRKTAAAGQDSPSGSPLPVVASASDGHRSANSKNKQDNDEFVGEWH